MNIIAVGKNLRTSPQKARLVTSQIKKMNPGDAVRILEFMPNKSSKLIKKVIESAIANAKNNHGLTETTLTFKEIQVGKGAMFKRFRPISRGRTHSIHKTTSHVRVVLEGDKGANKKIAKELEEPKETEPVKNVNILNTEKKSENTQKSSSSSAVAKEKKNDK